jgi:hypothetical protein
MSRKLARQQSKGTLLKLVKHMYAQNQRNMQYTKRLEQAAKLYEALTNKRPSVNALGETILEDIPTPVAPEPVGP